MKIEIRKGIKRGDFQERIAFSPHANMQVILKTHTLEQMMKNKIEAALNRKDIRDFFDIEFLLRQGVPLEAGKTKLNLLKKISGSFKEGDYRVTLGSVLGPEARKFYRKSKFDYLLRKINASLA